ncbi:amine oxidase [flavin-containing] B-like, partial [Saccoglossus kowalevskii]
VPLLEPWNCPKAKEWDSISTKAWLDEVCWTDTAKNVISILLHSIHACEPKELSLLYFLWYIKSGAGTLRISSTEKGAQERKFVGGSQQICEKIVDLIGKDKILYNSPVVKIEQNDDGVIVSTASGRQIK